MRKEMYHAVYTIGPVSLVCTVAADAGVITVPVMLMDPASASQVLIDTSKADWEKYSAYISSVPFAPGDIVAIKSETLKKDCIDRLSLLMKNAVFACCYRDDGTPVKVELENGIEAMTGTI